MAIRAIRSLSAHLAGVCCLAMCAGRVQAQFGACCGDPGGCYEATADLCPFTFLPGQTCSPNPCHATGACCDFVTCVETALLGCPSPAIFHAGETCSASICLSGPFRPGQAWETTGPNLTVIPDDPNDPGDFARLMFNTDGGSEPTFESYPIIPQVLADHLDNVEFGLSPDHMIVSAVAFGNALSGCGAGSSKSRVYFFRAVQDNDAGGHLEQIYVSDCLNGLVRSGLYNVTGQARRTAFFVDAKDNAASMTQRIHWVNLNAIHDSGVTALDADIDFIEFSPDGSTAFVQHGVRAQPAQADYELIDLCPGGRLGDSLDGSQLSNLPAPAATAAVVETSPGQFAARVSHPSLPGGSGDFPLVPCGGAPVIGSCCDGVACTETTAAGCSALFTPGGTCIPNPCAAPGTQQCCLPDGSCQNLAPDDCTSQGGTSGGPGTNCSNPNCPPPAGAQACCFNTGACMNLPIAICATLGAAPQQAGSNCLNGNPCRSIRLRIIKSGPGLAEQGCPFTYTLTYQNTGTTAANNVTIRDTLAANAVFVSADQNGALTGNRVEWNLGTVPAGASGQVKLTVAGFCTGSQYTLSNSSYEISASPGGTFSGTSTVNTTLTAPLAGSVGMTVGSLPDAPAVQPLRSGDVVTHTITLTNSLPQDRCGLRFSVGAGDGQRLDAVLFAGGGAVDTSNPFNWQWRGGIPAGTTVQVVITTIVEDCLLATQTDGTLNRGLPIELRHGCGLTLASATGPMLALQPPFVAEVESNLAPIPSLVLEDIAGNGDCAARRLSFQLARPGQAAIFTIRVYNLYPTPQAGVTVEIPVPPGITVNDPPFVEPTDPGATFDSAARTIRWSGDMAGMAGVVMTFEGTIDPVGPCRSVVRVAGTTQACRNQGQCCQPPIEADLSIFKVPPPPARPHVVGIDSIHDAGYNYGLWYLEPGAQTTFQPFLCLPTCIYHRMARSPTGQFWMVRGPPLAYFDPAALELRFFDAQDVQALKLLDLAGVAVDPRDGTAVMSGTSFAQVPALVRYDPGTQGSAVIYEGTTLGAIGEISIDSEGMVIDFDGSGRLRRFDPAKPSKVTEYTVNNISINGEGDLGSMDSVATSLLSFSIDRDGGFIVAVLKHYFRAAPFTAYELVQLGHIDPKTGAYSVIVDLLVGYGTAPLPPSLTPLLPYASQFGALPLLSTAVDSAGSIYVGTGESPGRLHVVHRSCAGVTGSELLGEGGPLLLQALNIAHSDAHSPRPLGDFDRDGDTDADDAAQFALCLTGPEVPYAPCSFPAGCVFMPDAQGTILPDADRDRDVDLVDFALFQRCFSGTNLPVDPDCLN